MDALGHRGIQAIEQLDQLLTLFSQQLGADIALLCGDRCARAKGGNSADVDGNSGDSVPNPFASLPIPFFRKQEVTSLVEAVLQQYPSRLGILSP